MSEEPKNIEVISGDGSELNISPVYDHISAGKPNIEDKKKNIIIPCTDKTYLNKQQEKSNEEQNHSQEDSNKEQEKKEDREEKEENVSSNLEDQNDVNQDDSSDKQEDTDSNS